MDKTSFEESETNSPVGTPFTGYVVLGKKESKLKYGIAVYTPFGSTISWQDGWTGRFVTTRVKLLSVYFQPTISYKINEKLGIGGGFVYGVGKGNFYRDLPIVDGAGQYGKAELEGNSKGYGYNVGVFYKPAKNVSFGITYRSGVEMKIKKGNAKFTVPASLAANFPSGDFAANVKLPKIITFGTAINPTSKLTLAFDASLIGWKTFDTLTFDYANNTTELPDTKLARNYKNTFSYRLGAQYSLTNKLDARFGVKYLISPVEDGYVSPDVPDATHFNYSIGLGYKLSSRLAADVSFTFQSMERADTNTETQMSGVYKTYIYMPGLSLNYNF